MRIVIGALFAIALTACSVTEQDKSATVDKPTASAFLGNTGELRPARSGQALLVYFNQKADWRRYDKVFLEPVTVGLGPNHALSEQNQTMLASYYYNALEQNLSKDFTMVKKPGPDVMTVRVALTDASTATPVLRTISVVVPQARVLDAADNLATGSYAFVGSAQSEGEVLDSTSGVRLAAAVDRRSGGLSVKNADVWEWGDAEHAMNYWAQHWSQALADLHSGKQASSR